MSLSYTDEELTILLTHLFVNMNNLDATYYDMFYNQTPMDITLERYDSDGELKEYQVPNRAKDRAYITIGNGTPEGNIVANVGAQYIDQVSSSCYYKATGYDTAVGWAEYLTKFNFVKDREYLSPTSNGSGLTHLNATQITTGVLGVANGGTGAVTLNGILKGNGTNGVVSAVDGRDYLSPSTFIGCIVWVPYRVTSSNLPVGWLIADGSQVYISDYLDLYNKIGSIWGPAPSEQFTLPNATQWMNNPADKSTPLIKY